MKTIKNLLLTGFALLLVSTTVRAQGDIINAADFMKLFKADKNLVIIDASKAGSYAKTHIKNAVNIPHNTLYQESEIEGLLKPPIELAEIFASKGVGNDATIVVYDGGSQKYASRVYWVLKYLGASNVKLFHKDMNAWRKVRVPITKMPSKAKTATFTLRVNPSIYADMADVKNGKATLIDARTTEEFNGTADNSRGHLPGAIHINYKDLLTETDAFKSKAEIEAILKQHGITSATPMIGYCRTSVRATVIYAAIVNILGWNNFRVYDGAYSEWVAKGNKVETKAGVSVKKKAATSSGGC